MRRTTLRLATALMAAMLFTSMASTGAAAHGRSGDALDLLRAAIGTARFHSTTQATKAGYGPFPDGVPLHECISSFDDTGSMGFHWVNGNLLDGELIPSRPEVLVYEPDQRGDLHLVALEYVVFRADWIAAHGDTTPMLFGQPFMDSGFPNRYEIPRFYALHLWLWKANPAGLFEPFNRRVSCDGATGTAGAPRIATRGVLADLAAAASARAGFVCSMRRPASA